LSSGYELVAGDLKTRLSTITMNLRTTMDQTRDFLIRLADYGPTDLQAAYTASGSTTAAQDAADLAAAQQAMTDIILFATYASATTPTRTDNTAGTAAVTISVPIGSYAIVSADATTIGILKSVGTDKGPQIRKPSPLMAGY